MIRLAYNETHGSIPDGVRTIVQEICDVSEREIRKLLPALPRPIDLIIASGKRVIPKRDAKLSL